MPRFPQPDRMDIPVSVSLDGGFVGVDCRREQDFNDTMQGRVQEAWNINFLNGDADTRWGCCAPVHFNPGFTTLRGGAVFSDPLSSEYLLAADADTTWLLCDCITPRRLPLPAGTTLNDSVSMLQAFDKMLMFRGVDLDSLIWSGNPNEPWSLVDNFLDFERPDYLSTLPKAEWGILVSDRVLVPISRDEIGWSDILEPNRFDLTLNRARFNQGEDDSLVAAARYQGSRVVVWKDQSIWFLNNFYGDLANLTIDRLPGKIGCLARDSVQDIGGDLLWLAHDGVYSLGQTEQGNMRGATLPLSAPIENIMRRVNWAHAHKASATFANQKYQLAVPLDGSDANNALLVYDLLTQTWNGVHTYAATPPPVVSASAPNGVSLFHSGLGFQMCLTGSAPAPEPSKASQLVATDLFGQRTAFMLDGTRILALGHGEVDRADAVSERPIATLMRSRGYMLDQLRMKALRDLAVVYGSRNAEISISVSTEGVRESIPIQTNRKRDRTRYLITGKPAYRLNDGARFMEPHREDYTWMASDRIDLPPAGIPLGILQEFDKGHAVRRLGRSFSVTISTTRGRLKIRGIQAQGISIGNTPNTRS